MGKLMLSLMLVLALVGCKSHELNDKAYSELAETFSIGGKKINELMILKAEDVINELSTEYEIIPAGAELLRQGYYYSKYDVTIIFDNDPYNENEYNKIERINCGKDITIGGATLGMTFSEIQNIWGHGEVIDLYPHEEPDIRYVLSYRFENFRVNFSAEEKDGQTIYFSISGV